MKTRAIVFTAPNKAALQSIAMPPPREGEVQVRTMLSTISAGTENWIYQNRFTWSPTPYPCVPGYQRVGTVLALGPGVRGWRVGERVMAIAGDWKGKVNSMWGSHLAVANTPVGHLFRLHPSVPDVEASCAVVAQVGYNAAHRPTVSRADWVVVYGDGLIGQFGAQSARARGCKVILVGHRENRLEIAAKCSAHVVINNRKEDVVATVHKHTKGKPVPVVIDTVQGEAVQKEYMPLLEPARGQVVYSGFSPEPAWASMALLQQKEITAHFVAGWTRPRMESTFRLMAEGKIRVQPLISHMVPYTEGPAMYEMIRLKTNDFMGITLDWREAEK